MNYIKSYNMELYSVSRDTFKPQLHKIPQKIELINITESLLEENKAFYATHYKLWKHN